MTGADELGNVTGHANVCALLSRCTRVVSPTRRRRIVSCYSFLVREPCPQVGPISGGQVINLAHQALAGYVRTAPHLGLATSPPASLAAARSAATQPRPLLVRCEAAPTGTAVRSSLGSSG